MNNTRHTDTLTTAQQRQSLSRSRYARRWNEPEREQMLNELEAIVAETESRLAEAEAAA